MPSLRLHTARTARALLASLAIVAASACGDSTSPGPSNPATETYASSLGVNIASMTKVSDQLYYQDLVVGTGTPAGVGRTVTMIYTGWLTNGTQFDTDVGKTPLFSFTIGHGDVIPGWDLGVPGMRVGGTRLLVIGSDLAYGSGGRGTIPKNATLVFKVQLTNVQ